MTDLKDSEQATNPGIKSDSQTSPSAVDIENQPMPDSAPEVDSNRNDPPPVRLGQASQAPEKPTEGDTDDNPIHHTGHMPRPVTTNRE
jgi:hypothetical protein